MLGPAILAGVVERDQRPIVRVACRDVWAFEAVAAEAGKGQIVERGGAAMLLADRMVRFMCGKRDIFGNPAVFATTVCPLDDGPTQRGWDVGGTHSSRARRATPPVRMTWRAVNALRTLGAHADEGDDVIEEDHTIQLGCLLPRERTYGVAV
jgi:hypothetical protein